MPPANPPPQPPAFAALPFRQIAETANDIIIVTTPNLEPPGPTILYVNPAFTNLTGHSAADAIGQTPRILQGPGTSRATLDLIRATLTAGGAVHEKILNYAKCGAPYWLDLRIVPLRDAAGAIIHFAAIERDVTMDKRRLDELEYIADRDTLTGIPNRRAFLRGLEEEIEAAETRRAAAQGPCLALIDIDHFKKVNDERGHLIGDAVLFATADPPDREYPPHGHAGPHRRRGVRRLHALGRPVGRPGFGRAPAPRRRRQPGGNPGRAGLHHRQHRHHHLH